MLQSMILYVELDRRLANLSKSDQHREHVVAVQLALLQVEVGSRGCCRANHANQQGWSRDRRRSRSRAMPA